MIMKWYEMVNDNEMIMVNNNENNDDINDNDNVKMIIMKWWIMIMAY